jgi:hypothetical protein
MNLLARMISAAAPEIEKNLQHSTTQAAKHANDCNGTGEGGGGSEGRHSGVDGLGVYDGDDGDQNHKQDIQNADNPDGDWVMIPRNTDWDIIKREEIHHARIAIKPETPLKRGWVVCNPGNHRKPDMIYEIQADKPGSRSSSVENVAEEATSEPFLEFYETLMSQPSLQSQASQRATLGNNETSDYQLHNKISAPSTAVLPLQSHYAHARSYTAIPPGEQGAAAISQGQGFHTPIARHHRDDQNNLTTTSRQVNSPNGNTPSFLPLLPRSPPRQTSVLPAHRAEARPWGKRESPSEWKRFNASRAAQQAINRAQERLNRLDRTHDLSDQLAKQHLS